MTPSTLRALGCALLLTLASACTTVEFTQELREEHALTEPDLTGLQYYVSDTITLQRELPAGEPPRVSGGKLVLREGKRIEEVIVPSGTPGICVGTIGEHGLKISFEEGTHLRFGSGGDYAGPYLIYGDEWQDGVGTLSFDGLTWSAVHDSDDACLLIDEDSLTKIQRAIHVAPGRRLDDEQDDEAPEADTAE